MTRKFLWIALILSFTLVFSTAAFAQDDDVVDDDFVDDDVADDDVADDDAVVDDDAADDDIGETTFDDSTVEFTSPAELGENTEYQFVFEVFNAAQEVAGDKGIWVNKVEILLPGGADGEYILAEEADQPMAPDCLHPGEYCDYWEAMFDYTNKQITWQSFGTVTTVEYGDIREQDVQTFAFIATTDQYPTDGFAWTLFGDDGSFLEGLWNFLPEPDDDTIDDDTFEPDDDDGGDDDDDDDGCGC